MTIATRTSVLRRQHDAAMAIAQETGRNAARFADAPRREDAYALTLSLARLTGLLHIHFAQEDRLLYPQLMAVETGDVAEVAQRFFKEMGPISAYYADVTTRWSSVDALMAEPQRFAREVTELFAALGQRIRRENQELYPLAEALWANSGLASAR
ncbi:MAG TPA: hemerythrin domain-containing protein [Sphingobium sp.]